MKRLDLILIMQQTTTQNCDNRKPIALQMQICNGSVLTQAGRIDITQARQTQSFQFPTEAIPLIIIKRREGIKKVYKISILFRKLCYEFYSES